VKIILLQILVTSPSLPLIKSLNSNPKIVVSALDATKSMQNSGTFGVVAEVAVENTSFWDVDEI
jgi:hypothetical protein